MRVRRLPAREAARCCFVEVARLLEARILSVNMHMTFPKAAIMNPVAVLRRAGYSPFRDPNTEEESFVLRLGATFYPRFHLYVRETEQDVTLDLHLDQKQSSYEGASQHNGEYAGPTVEREMKRIESWVSDSLRESRQIDPPPTPKKSYKPRWIDWFTGSSD